MPPGVPATSSVASEDAIPIDVSRLQLARRRVPAIRASDSTRIPESSFGEVQPVSDVRPMPRTRPTDCVWSDAALSSS